jgi:16S rRNA processing protein RimM
MTGKSGQGSKTHVVMGRVGAPWGVKGWVKVHSFAEPPENLLDYREFDIETPDGLRKLVFDDMKPQGQGFVGHIKGCDAREQTGAWTGSELLLDKAELPGLDEGFYWHELEGLRVVNLQGVVLGSVHHLMETGANDVLVVRGDEGSVDRIERLLPWVEGQVIVDVDLESGVVKVDWDPVWDTEA